MRRAWPLLLLAACGMQPTPESAEDLKGETRIFRARLEMRTLASEIQSYHALRGEWPEDWGDLRRSGRDPWGGVYDFYAEGSRVVLVSPGPDGEPETGDDVVGGS